MDEIGGEMDGAVDGDAEFVRRRELVESRQQSENERQCAGVRAAIFREPAFFVLQKEEAFEVVFERGFPSIGVEEAAGFLEGEHGERKWRGAADLALPG